MFTLGRTIPDIGKDYLGEQKTAIVTACGNVFPCSDPAAASAAMLAVRGNWALVWTAWAAMHPGAAEEQKKSDDAAEAFLLRMQDKPTCQ